MDALFGTSFIVNSGLTTSAEWQEISEAPEPYDWNRKDIIKLFAEKYSGASISDASFTLAMRDHWKSIFLFCDGVVPLALLLE